MGGTLPFRGAEVWCEGYLAPTADDPNETVSCLVGFAGCARRFGDFVALRADMTPTTSRTWFKQL
jgi:hypothetical protein